MPSSPKILSAFVASFLLGACAAPPRPPEPAKPSRQEGRQSLAGDSVVEYAIEIQPSRLDARSCFGFITGTISNHGAQTLSRRSGLQVLVYGRDGLIFRDLTHPRTDVPPGGRVQFELVQSPVHRGQCPAYERVEMILTPIRLPAP